MSPVADRATRGQWRTVSDAPPSQTAVYGSPLSPPLPQPPGPAPLLLVTDAKADVQPLAHLALHHAGVDRLALAAHLDLPHDERVAVVSAAVARDVHEVADAAHDAGDAMPHRIASRAEGFVRFDPLEAGVANGRGAAAQAAGFPGAHERAPREEDR